MHLKIAAMTDAALVVGEGENVTLILRQGLVRPSVAQTLAEALKDVILPHHRQAVS